jgi:hypothetical protein
MRDQATGSVLLLLGCSLLYCSGPSIQGVCLWRGDAGCSACAAGALNVMTDPSSTLELVPDDTYTLEIRLSDPDDNHCIRDPVWTTWDLPQRERGCLSEDSQVTRTFSTKRLWLVPPPEERLEITVTEYASDSRSPKATLFSKRYVVQWASQQESGGVVTRRPTSGCS